MAVLVTLKGPNPGREFPLESATISLGRHADAAVFLESQAVSRQHARIMYEEGDYFVEDLNSSNGTFLNGKRLRGRAPLTEQDTLQIGPYFLGLRNTPAPAPREDSLIIREQVSADPSSLSLHGVDAARKLKVVLEISQVLARTLDPDALFGKLLDHLMQLFTQADRGIVLLYEGERLVVRGHRSRLGDNPGSCSYSRTIVRRALDDGVGLLSENVGTDLRFTGSATLTSLNIHSLLCVPLISSDGKRLGILQLDRYTTGVAFDAEDLQLLTAVGLQVGVVLENAAMHVQLLREERLRQELALAREIQEGFLPSEFPGPEGGYELFARVLPAREVSGDFYDFFALPGNRLAFFVGDVSGKGMPAALFMVAIRILGRHLGSAGHSPSEMLARLNTALAADNPSGMFVTLAHGIYHADTGEILMTSCGHPLPLLRRPDGTVQEVDMPSGRLLGYENGDLGLHDSRFTLGRGETLILYTDGCNEAHAPDSRVLFGIAKLEETLGGPRTEQSLEACADYTKATVEQFIGTTELPDDLTLLLLRRV